MILLASLKMDQFTESRVLVVRCWGGKGKERYSFNGTEFSLGRWKDFTDGLWYKT